MYSTVVRVYGDRISDCRVVQIRALEMTDEDYNAGELVIWNFFTCVVEIHR